MRIQALTNGEEARDGYDCGCKFSIFNGNPNMNVDLPSVDDVKPPGITSIERGIIDEIWSAKGIRRADVSEENGRKWVMA